MKNLAALDTKINKRAWRRTIIGKGKPFPDRETVGQLFQRLDREGKTYVIESHPSNVSFLFRLGVVPNDVTHVLMVDDCEEENYAIKGTSLSPTNEPDYELSDEVTKIEKSA